MKTRPDSDGTRVAANPDKTRLAIPPYSQPHVDDDPTRIDQAGYHSILLSRADPPLGQIPERYTIGDKIDGRYEVLAIHRGSMGIVYGTFDHKTKLPRALKTLQQRYAGDQTMRNLFVEEASVWVRLEKHPFIVRAYLVEVFDNQAYIIAGIIRGQEAMGVDLRAWLGRPELTFPVAMGMALQIGQAMQHAARKVPGLVHRDLKPANVLVDDRGRALVTDFGLVYAEHATAGTPAYMAPEQWLGKKLDQRTDIYAFGCILYEMLTGHRLFAAEGIEGWKAAHLGYIAVSPRKLNGELPVELEGFVLRCLAKDMPGRPSDWDEVVDVCGRWFHRLTGQPAVLNFSAYGLTRDELDTATFHSPNWASTKRRSMFAIGQSPSTRWAMVAGTIKVPHFKAWVGRTRHWRRLTGQSPSTRWALLAGTIKAPHFKAWVGSTRHWRRLTGRWQSIRKLLRAGTPRLTKLLRFWA